MYWITGILGIAFAAAPFLLGYNDNAMALWTSLVLGGAIVGVSLLEGISEGKERWEYWVAAVVGIGAMIAPFILNFGNFTAAMWTSITVGVLLTVIAGSKLFYDRQSYG